MVETVRTLKIYDLNDKPFDRVEKRARGRVIAFALPTDHKVDVCFDDGRMFMIPKRWLRKIRAADAAVRP